MIPLQTSSFTNLELIMSYLDNKIDKIQFSSWDSVLDSGGNGHRTGS